MPYQRERNATPGNGRMAKENSVRFAIRLAYDGTDYQGFQSQPHGNTIQDQLEYRLSHLLKRKIRIFGWGRTDTGEKFWRQRFALFRPKYISLSPMRLLL